MKQRRRVVLAMAFWFVCALCFLVVAVIPKYGGRWNPRLFTVGLVIGLPLSLVTLAAAHQRGRMLSWAPRVRPTDGTRPAPSAAKETVRALPWWGPYTFAAGVLALFALFGSVLPGVVAGWCVGMGLCMPWLAWVADREKD